MTPLSLFQLSINSLEKRLFGILMETQLLLNLKGNIWNNSWTITQVPKWMLLHGQWKLHYTWLSKHTNWNTTQGKINFLTDKRKRGKPDPSVEVNYFRWWAWKVRRGPHCSTSHQPSHHSITQFIFQNYRHQHNVSWHWKEAENFAFSSYKLQGKY